MLELSYLPENEDGGYPMINLSTSAGYKFSKRFYLNLDVGFSYFRANTKYTKTLKNLVNNTILDEETFGKKKNIFTFSPSIGLIVILKYSKKELNSTE